MSYSMFSATSNDRHRHRHDNDNNGSSSSSNSHGNFHARPHSSLDARWNEPREHIDQDDRRRSMNAMGELHGAAFYERPDWPLPRDRRKGARQSGTVAIEHDLAGGNDIGRRWDGNLARTNAAPDLDEPDVSDIEEEEDDEHDRDSLRGGRDSALHVHPRAGLRRESLAEAYVDISPPEEDRMLEAPAAWEAQESQNTISLDPEEIPSRRPHDEAAAFERGETLMNGVHRDDNGDRPRDVPAEPMVTVPTPTRADAPEATTNGAVDDIDTNCITPTVSSHLPRSSTFKSPLNPGLHRRSSTRSSLNLYASPSRKERVRYSWQSIQDAEPNRPRIHIIKLVSNTVTSSAGFPQGEAFGFSISSGGRRIAAYNSARLYVLQTAALPVGISQDYALKRRPLAVELTDEPNSMAILADDHTVNIYELGVRRMHLRRTIKLDFPTNCIALAPTGGLLAAAYEGGVEIFSLHPSALPTDRRAVRSARMDRMAFSEDGSTLLGTTIRINISSTVVVSVPIFPAAPDGVPTHEELKEAWCAELLHPENIRNSSHATFMRENRKTCNDRLFAWNGLADTFGILNVGDMQYGNVDFPIVIAPPLSTCGGLGAAIHSCPSIDEHGDTVAMIVNDRTIRLYIVPRGIEGGPASVEAHSIDHELDEGYGCPFSEVRWVHNAASQPSAPNAPKHVMGRLIVTSPGAVSESGNAEDSFEDIEGGRIILFDFDPQFAGQPGQTYNLNLGKCPPQMLEEESVDVAEQVALVRRRTVNQSKKANLSSRPITLGRAATTFGKDRAPRSSNAAARSHLNTPARASMLSIGSMQSEAARSLPDLMETQEQTEVFEEPYAQFAPRSQASLQRAATNAQRHRFQALEERDQEGISVESTGNFLALPEYTEEPNAPLPSRFRAMAGLDQPTVWSATKADVASSSNGNPVSPASSGPSTAPPVIGEHFSAEQAFSAANAAAAASRPRVPTPPPDGATLASISSAAETLPPSGGVQLSDPRPISPTGRTGVVDPATPLPRSIQRAYNNAPLGPAPPLIGDWQNVSPITDRRSSRTPAAPVADATPRPGSQQWERISPVQAPSPPGTGAGPGGAGGGYVSLQSGHTHPQPPPASFASQIHNLPPHMQARQQAAAASLFPPSLPPDHVPLRQPPVKPSAVAHPITSWRPPGAGLLPPSSSATGPAGFPTASASTSHLPSYFSDYPRPQAVSRAGSRLHTRQDSSAGRHALGSPSPTDQPKRLGFFSRRRNRRQNANANDVYSSQREAEADGGSLLETRSVMTWVASGREGKCAIM